ncbi:unnamed protein product [Triticum aestivum]|uniref:DUF3615 domain-containing protein n=2 Tax=Triticum aestivum TaxID=4565 RepID=A0A9R1JJC1_WHEAT|nr:uncharacterized protein LOC123050613 [Triticum aestivum]KAF7019586.1 hypothetical protein CFC21_032745 [Triticum aestivum]SPT20872.1 unnamed protein product [Triticum aestivum]
MAGAAEGEARPLVVVGRGARRSAKVSAAAAEGETRPLVGAKVMGPRLSLSLSPDALDLIARREALLSEWAASEPSASPSLPEASASPWSLILSRCLPSSLQPQPEPEPFDRVEHNWNSSMMMMMMPSPSEVAAAQDHQLVMECLRHYNLNHPENEYVPAPGKVTRYSSPHNGSCWTHGNFVASPKHSGYFSLLPPRPTLLFYELVTKDGFEGVVSCTPLDEPVTEAYSLFGLHLGWGTRRDGSSDCLCNTCNRLVDSEVPSVGNAFPCGHYKAERVCQMCYLQSEVLHPSPEKFAFGK